MTIKTQFEPLQPLIWQQRAEAMAEIVNASIAVWESHEFSAIYAGPQHAGERAIVSDEALHRLGKAIELFKAIAEQQVSA